jgi:glycine cleavage system aminomethyltransferase T
VARSLTTDQGAVWWVQAAGKDVSMTVHDDRGLLALQGPAAAGVLAKLTKRDLTKLYFGMFDR